MTKQWEKPPVSHRLPDYMRERNTGFRRELTHNDLHTLERLLMFLRRYFEHGGECERKTDDCIEVVRGLRNLWIRDSVVAKRRYDADKTIVKAERHEP